MLVGSESLQEASKPLIAEEAVQAIGASVRDQLLQIGEHSDDLCILEQQRQLKAEAREAKAARMLAKGTWVAGSDSVVLVYM